MARPAEPHDVWSASGQQWLEDRLNLEPGRNAVVQVVENRVHVSLHTGLGDAEWVLESGGEWTVACSLHRGACGTAFVADDGATILERIEAWAVTHG